jgi:hypothetical protein
MCGVLEGSNHTRVGPCITEPALLVFCYYCYNKMGQKGFMSFPTSTHHRLHAQHSLDTCSSSCCLPSWGSCMSRLSRSGMSASKLAGWGSSCLGAGWCYDCMEEDVRSFWVRILNWVACMVHRISSMQAFLARMNECGRRTGMCSDHQVLLA